MSMFNEIWLGNEGDLMSRKERIKNPKQYLSDCNKKISMTDDKLIEYIKSSLNRGISEANIRNSLIKSGWNESDVNNAFSYLRMQPQNIPPTPLPANPGSIKGANNSNIARYGFIFSLISAIIVFCGILMNLYVILFVTVPSPSILQFFGVDTSTFTAIYFLKSIFGWISTAIIAFFGLMIFFGALKLRRGDKVKKMGILIVIYSIIIFFFVFGILGTIASIFGIVGGLLGYKGR